VQKKLTIVVTCTDRKSVKPSAELQIRNLHGVGLSARAQTWRHRIDAASDRYSLRSLYQGETWTQVALLERAAERAGFTPRLLVASAGLGLVDGHADAPSYAATFSAGHPDSVGSSRNEAQEWWQALNPPGQGPVLLLDDPTVLVLSRAYADAMVSTLAPAADRRDVVIFGGSDAIPPGLRIPADRGLRKALGGTATSLNLRTARAWFDLLPAPNLALYRQHAGWTAWATSARKPDNYDRTPLTDDAVQAFVKKVHAEDPTISRSRALRLLRESGLACEQRRFAHLFTSTLESA
jgi:hypothetical protein